MAEIKRLEVHAELGSSRVYIGDVEALVDDGRITKIISFLPDVKTSNESDAPEEEGFDEDQRPGASET